MFSAAASVTMDDADGALRQEHGHDPDHPEGAYGRRGVESRPTDGVIRRAPGSGDRANQSVAHVHQGRFSSPSQPRSRATATTAFRPLTPNFRPMRRTCVLIVSGLIES